jgi:hypothetical protein
MSFGFDSVFSLVSSGRSCRFANYDFHTQSLIEDFSKEKVGMEGCSDNRSSRFFLLCQQSGGRPFLSPLHDLGEAISESSNTQRSCFRMAFPKLFVPVPDRGCTCVARASSIWRGRDVEHDALIN